MTCQSRFAYASVRARPIPRLAPVISTVGSASAAAGNALSKASRAVNAMRSVGLRIEFLLFLDQYNPHLSSGRLRARPAERHSDWLVAFEEA